MEPEFRTTCPLPPAPRVQTRSGGVEGRAHPRGLLLLSLCHGLVPRPPRLPTARLAARGGPGESIGECRGPEPAGRTEAQRDLESVQLLQDMLNFPILVVNGIYTFCFLGDLSKWNQALSGCADSPKHRSKKPKGLSSALNIF